MAHETSPIVQWVQYLGARLAAMGLTVFDVEANLRSGAALGRLLFHIDSRHRTRMLNHLGWCFPELDQEQRSELARRSFEHFVQLVVEVLYTPRLIHPDSWSSRIQLGQIGQTLDLLNRGRPLLMITGHLGNWEILSNLLAILGYPIHGVARPLDNRLIHRWLLEIRERRGLRVIEKWNASQIMLDVIQKGHALGFIADQNAGDKGLFVPFFGRLASTYKSIGLLTISQQVPIVCGYARRAEKVGHEPGYRFELGTVDIIWPDEWVNQADPLYYVTARYMRAIETMVRACPQQYLWMHRRWKSRPAFERAGKPMPASLRQKIEQLPWMDQATMDRLQIVPGFQ